MNPSMSTAPSSSSQVIPKHHLLLSSLHATLGLALLLGCLGLVPPHSRDVVLVAHVPALLRENVHGCYLDDCCSGDEAFSSSQLAQQASIDWKDNEHRRKMCFKTCDILYKDEVENFVQQTTDQIYQQKRHPFVVAVNRGWKHFFWLG